MDRLRMLEGNGDCVDSSRVCFSRWRRDSDPQWVLEWVLRFNGAKIVKNGSVLDSASRAKGFTARGSSGAMRGLVVENGSNVEIRDDMDTSCERGFPGVA
jgi:hypothetical protein